MYAATIVEGRECPIYPVTNTSPHLIDRALSMYSEHSSKNEEIFPFGTSLQTNP